ncbi:hypothetical protein MBLNU230_g5053t1 [Neophaeotheca triangularis]
MALTLANARVANWVCGGLTIGILIVRLLSCLGRKPRKFDLTIVALVISSITALLARAILNHYYLQYGQLTDYGPSSPDHVTAPEITTATILCVLLLLFYTNVVSHITWTRYGIRFCWVLIITTYIAVVLATFLECQPFRLYYEIRPESRPQCTRAYVQLVLQCGSNIAIDLVLLAISSPLLKYRDRTWLQRVQLGILYAIGTFCIIVSILRTVIIYDKDSAQAVRSVWASIQEIVAAFVANAPSVYGAIMLHRRKSTTLSRSTGSRSADAGQDASADAEQRGTGDAQDRIHSILKLDDPPHLREYLANNRSEVSVPRRDHEPP